VVGEGELEEAATAEVPEGEATEGAEGGEANGEPAES
jgi:hypothetical protein